MNAFFKQASHKAGLMLFATYGFSGNKNKKFK
jgi:hypothetical protein